MGTANPRRLQAPNTQSGHVAANSHAMFPLAKPTLREEDAPQMPSQDVMHSLVAQQKEIRLTASPLAKI